MARYAAASAASSSSSSSPASAAVINEFRDMVKACHARGIEVILDVVFNHTAEGNEQGPAVSLGEFLILIFFFLLFFFLLLQQLTTNSTTTLPPPQHNKHRGLDNRTYYMLAPAGQYYNYSGCGNTLNCNHPTVRALILDALRYWVSEMHVDGFRFDLASILTRAHSAWAPSTCCREEEQ